AGDEVGREVSRDAALGEEREAISQRKIESRQPEDADAHGRATEVEVEIVVVDAPGRVVDADPGAGAQVGPHDSRLPGVAHQGAGVQAVDAGGGASDSVCIEVAVLELTPDTHVVAGPPFGAERRGRPRAAVVWNENTARRRDRTVLLGAGGDGTRCKQQ